MRFGRLLKLANLEMGLTKTGHLTLPRPGIYGLSKIMREFCSFVGRPGTMWNGNGNARRYQSWRRLASSKPVGLKSGPCLRLQCHLTAVIWSSNKWFFRLTTINVFVMPRPLIITSLICKSVSHDLYFQWRAMKFSRLSEELRRYNYFRWKAMNLPFFSF